MRELDLSYTNIHARGLMALNLHELRVLDIRGAQGLTQCNAIAVVAQCRNLQASFVSKLTEQKLGIKIK